MVSNKVVSMPFTFLTFRGCGLEKMVTRNANVFQKTFAFNSHHAGGLYVDVLLFQVFPIRSAEKDKKLLLLA